MPWLSSSSNTAIFRCTPSVLSSPSPPLQHLVFLEREGSCVFSHWLLSIDNIWLKTVRQSAQSLDALSALTQYSISCEVSMNAVLWGQHREIAPVHLTYGKFKPGSFVQRKRGNNLHLPLPIHMWLMIIQSPICNSLSHVCERKHETEGFLPALPDKLNQFPYHALVLRHCHLA